MTKQEGMLLFNSMHPDFFETENVRNIPDEYIYDEMVLSLDKFEPCKYDRKLDENIASFCLVANLGMHNINGRKVKVGGPGCVGTIPEYRNKGIGLTMVKHITQILKEEGYDYSYIHFTGVATWYEKLGYKTSIKWTGKGFCNI